MFICIECLERRDLGSEVLTIETRRHQAKNEGARLHLHEPARRRAQHTGEIDFGQFQILSCEEHLHLITLTLKESSKLPGSGKVRPLARKSCFVYLFNMTMQLSERD